MPPPAQRTGSEPIVIPNCYVQYEDRQQVSAEVDGKIEIIGSPLTKRADGRFEWRQPGAEPIVYDPAKPHPSIVFHPRDPEEDGAVLEAGRERLRVRRAGPLPARRPDDHHQEEDRREDERGRRRGQESC